MAVLGGLMALGGLATYTVQGVRKIGKQEKEASAGTWRNQYQENSSALRDPSHISYDNEQPVEMVMPGIYGLPRTYYKQPGTDALIRAYGRPNQNIMKMGQKQ